MKINIIVLFFIISLHSCRYVDINSREIDTPTLVVNIILNTNKNVNYAYIGYNFSADQYAQDEDIKDVEAYIISPPGVRYDFYPIPDSLSNNSNRSKNFMLKDSLEFLSGEEYCLYVSKPDYPMLTSCAIVPNIVELDEYNLRNDPASISFTDPNEDNYYYLAGSDGFEFKELNDPSANSFYESYSSYIIKDDIFNGLTKTILMPVEAAYLNKKAIRFGTIDQNEYEFIKTSRLQEESKRNPYIGEHRIHSNVKNGFGIFSINHIKKYE